jgi:hypothetical protein
MVRVPAAERAHAGTELQEFVRRYQPLISGMIDVTDVVRTALYKHTGGMSWY